MKNEEQVIDISCLSSDIFIINDQISFINSNVEEETKPSLSVQDVQAIKSFLEKEIFLQEQLYKFAISVAKNEKIKNVKNIRYKMADRISSRISKMAKVQKNVKKFLTESHV